MTYNILNSPRPYNPDLYPSTCMRVIESDLPEGAQIRFIEGVQLIIMPSALHPNPKDLEGHFVPAVPYKTLEQKV
jgi:hypothetical protein